MLVFAPASLLSFLALVSCVAGGVVRGAARGVVNADARSFVGRAVDAAPRADAVPAATPVAGALFRGRVHQELGW